MQKGRQKNVWRSGAPEGLGGRGEVGKVSSVTVQWRARIAGPRWLNETDRLSQIEVFNRDRSPLCMLGILIGLRNWGKLAGHET